MSAVGPSTATSACMASPHSKVWAAVDSTCSFASGPNTSSMRPDPYPKSTTGPKRSWSACMTPTRFPDASRGSSAR